MRGVHQYPPQLGPQLLPPGILIHQLKLQGVRREFNLAGSVVFPIKGLEHQHNQQYPKGREGQMREVERVDEVLVEEDTPENVVQAVEG